MVEKKSHRVQSAQSARTFWIVFSFMFGTLIAMSFVQQPNPQQEVVFDMLQRFIEVSIGFVAGVKSISH
jgi:hypothetical protein